jgi:hypothetical protein
MPNFFCIEQMASRAWSYDAGKVSTSRVFKVYDNTVPSSLQTPADVRAWFGIAVGGNVSGLVSSGPDALPVKGELFPDETGVWAKSYAIAREPNTDIWTVTWNYSNAQVSAASLQPAEVGYVEWTLDIAAAFADTYISAPTYPSNGTLTNPANTQITGGTQIDLEGVPLSRLKYTSELVINETIQQVSGLPSMIANMRAARGKRNSALWEGFSIGTVLYTGGQIRRAGVSLFTVTHRFIEDSEYHLVQVPERDGSGKIPCAELNGARRARKVFWRQPFPSTADFANISTNW